jgi:hypothetical protein
MRNRDTRLAVLDMLDAGERRARHGWVLDDQVPAEGRSGVERVVSEGLAELADQAARAELSALSSRPVPWAARLTPYGRDALVYARALPLPESEPDEPAPGEQHVHLRPAQMDALRRFVSLAAELAAPPAEGLAERVRAAYFSRTDNRWLLCLTRQQITSVAYGLYLHGNTCSEAERYRFARDYNVIFRPCPETGVPTAVDLTPAPRTSRAGGPRAEQV